MTKTSSESSCGSANLTARHHRIFAAPLNPRIALTSRGTYHQSRTHPGHKLHGRISLRFGLFDQSPPTVCTCEKPLSWPASLTPLWHRSLDRGLSHNKGLNKWSLRLIRPRLNRDLFSFIGDIYLGLRSAFFLKLLVLLRCPLSLGNMLRQDTALKTLAASCQAALISFLHETKFY